MHYSIARILFGIPNQQEPLLSIFLKLPASHLFDEVSRSGNLKDNAVHFHQQSEIKFSLKREILLFGSFCFDPSSIWLYFFRDGLGGCYLGIATALLISNHIDPAACDWFQSDSVWVWLGVFIQKHSPVSFSLYSSFRTSLFLSGNNTGAEFNQAPPGRGWVGSQFGNFFTF